MESLVSVAAAVVGAAGASLASLLTAWFASRQSRAAERRAAEAADAAAELVKDIDETYRPEDFNRRVYPSWRREPGGAAGIDDRVSRLVESLGEAESIVTERSAVHMGRWISPLAVCKTRYAA